jgi:two-component system sensor histidine kinase/response regulator
LLGLLNDILDFSKIEAGKMTLDEYPFQVDQVMDNLSVILSANIGDKPVDVLFDLDPKIPATLIGDAMRLQQVLINLAGNALKFTNEGEVTVQVRLVEQQGRKVTLQVGVRDSGIGISPENQSHIFEGFSQAEASTTRRFGGTGLGLAICKRLVNLMGGQLLLESTPGRGSNFHFTIPMLATEDSVAIDGPVETPACDVLLVDSSAAGRGVMVRMMQSLGMRVVVASNGKDAVDSIAARKAAGTPPYRAIFIDCKLPQLEGWQTAQQIRQQFENSPEPVAVMLMVTAHGHELLARRKQTGAVAPAGYLIKPVTASTMLNAVNHVHPQVSAGESSPTVSGTRRLKGMRLLLVEDNIINQQVAQELLSAEGAIVTIVDNGRLGVDAVADADPPFAAVLMDLQMPVMDGLTATRLIRTELGQSALPIIAMTANAMDSDRDACLTAGMTDHVGKPFNLSHLVATLRQHTAWDARTTASPMTDSETASTAAAHAMSDVDAQGALLRLGGNQKLYLKLLKAFLSEMATSATQLQHLLQDRRLDEARRLLHTLKGTSATVGLHALASAAAQAEATLQPAGPLPDSASLLANLGAALASARTATEQQIQKIEADVPAISSEADAMGMAKTARHPENLHLTKQVRLLITLLESSDMHAVLVHADLNQSYGEAIQSIATALDTAMAVLDFAQARDLCMTLLDGLQE